MPLLELLRPELLLEPELRLEPRLAEPELLEEPRLAEPELRLGELGRELRLAPELLLEDPLLRDAELYEKFDGSGDVDLNLSTSGQTEQAVLKNLNGNIAFAFKDGGLKGLDLVKLYELGQQIRDQRKGKPVPAQTRTKASAARSNWSTAWPTTRTCRCS